MIAEEEIVMSSPMPPQGQPPAAKKTSIWVWIIGGVVVVLFGVAVMGGIAGYLAVRGIKSVAKTAGFDSELMQKNPGLAMAKMATAMNQDYETVKTNDSDGTITVREKSTGKIVTLKFDSEAKKMVIIGDDGKQATISVAGSGDNGSLTMQSSDGTVKLGAAADNTVPSWVPQYPGATMKGNLAATTAEGSQNSFSFNSSDSATKILGYYTDQLKAAGFKINLTTTTDTGGLVQAQDESKKRTIMVSSAAASGGTETSVTAIEKK